MLNVSSPLPQLLFSIDNLGTPMLLGSHITLPTLRIGNSALILVTMALKKLSLALLR